MHSSRMRTARCSGRLGGCMPGGVCLGGSARGVCLPRVVYTHPTVNKITDRCKNITFPKLRLRTVITLLIQGNSRINVLLPPQAVSNGILRGCGRQYIGAVLIFVAYVFMALPVGLCLMFLTPMRLTGS